MKEEIINKLLKLIKKAEQKNEVPVAAVLVKNNKIISSAYNKKNKTNNILMHAEILCILKCIKKMKNWRLDDCDLYVTLEPCDMCKNIIEEARIKNVYYFCEKTSKKISKTNYIHINTKINKYINTRLKTFFESKRK